MAPPFATKRSLPFLTVPALTAVMLMASHDAWSQDRRPCVAPGAPYNCDSTMKGAPQPMAGLGGGPPTADIPSRSGIGIPVEPSKPPPSPPPGGTVTLEPGARGGTATPTPPQQPNAPGPQPAPQ